jgi:3-hydroxyacyl-CoA dehydrogenase / enoyl-CoA hydratase / 3-hydroxybutyryl-CoA epimerase
MPVGPLAVVDETSLELRWKVVLQAREDGLGERFSQPAGVAVVEKMVQLGRTGRKTGGGFYDYPAGGKKQLWSELSEVFPVASAQPDVEEVRDRLLAIQALEAVHCLEEGVLVEPQEGDLGSILGVGFPAWTGGALSYVDTLGARSFVELCEALAAKCGPRFSPPASLRNMAAANRQYVTTPQRGAV